MLATDKCGDVRYFIMSLEHCQIVPMPEVVSRLAGNDHLSLGPAKYMSIGGHSIDAELLINGEPINGQHPYILGVGKRAYSLYGGDPSVDLTVPVDSFSNACHDVSLIPRCEVNVNLAATVLQFSVPRSAAHLALVEAVPLLLPEKLHHSAGVLLNFANVMAYYLPK